MQPNTRAVFLESPGSLSFEMQDVPAIAAAAHAKGAMVLMDNTWATPLYFRALDHGVDLSIQAGTKYIGGHSDVMLGTVAANSDTVADLKTIVRFNGLCVGPDDVYLGTARPAHARGAARAASRVRPRGRALAGAAPRSVARAASGDAKPSRPRAVEARFHRRLRAVQHGVQAGAAERRCTLFSIRSNCSASARPGAATKASPFRSTAPTSAPPTRWAPGGPTVRFHIGLEAVEDLIADLERGFAALADAAA